MQRRYTAKLFRQSRVIDKVFATVKNDEGWRLPQTIDQTETTSFVRTDTPVLRPRWRDQRVAPPSTQVDE